MKRKKWFVLTRVHRDDLDLAGFDSSNVSDDTMTKLVNQMCNAYLENGYWIDMEEIAVDLGIPRKPEE